MLQNFVLDLFKLLIDEDRFTGIDDIVHSGWLEEQWHNWAKSGKISSEAAHELETYNIKQWEELFEKKIRLYII